MKPTKTKYYFSQTGNWFVLIIFSILIYGGITEIQDSLIGLIIWVIVCAVIIIGNILYSNWYLKNKLTDKDFE